jgi:hypothetical protein
MGFRFRTKTTVNIFLLIVSILAVVAMSSSERGCLWQTDCETDGCEPGTFCKVVMEGLAFSQCVEIPTTRSSCYPTSNGDSRTALSRRGCTDDSQCCNSHAMCGTDQKCHLGCAYGGVGIESFDKGRSRPRTLTTPYPFKASILFANHTAPTLDATLTAALKSALAVTFEVKASSVKIISSAPTKKKLKEIYVVLVR